MTISTHDAERLAIHASLLLATDGYHSETPLLSLTDYYRESGSKGMTIKRIIITAYEYQEIADTKQTDLLNFSE